MKSCIKTADYQNDQLAIRFTGSTPEQFSYLLNSVKTHIEGRVWDNTFRVWRAPPLEKNLEHLRKLEFHFTPKLVEHIEGKSTAVVQGNTPEPAVLNDPRLEGLFPYQVEGVHFLEQHNGVGIIGDEMGLGKTVQALGYLLLHPEDRPALVVCPAVAKHVWVDACVRWLHLLEDDVNILSSRTCKKVEDRPIVVVNYDILKDWEGVLNSLGARILIGDEVQYVSNHKTLRTKAFVRVAKHVRKKVLLSGTPIKSYPAEFFTILNLVAPTIFPNRYKYMYSYCGPKHNGFGWIFKGATNQDELRQLIAPLMIRREKAEVLPDLPPKLKQVVLLDCSSTDYKAYKDAEDTFLAWVKDVEKKKLSLEFKNNVEILKQAAYLAKRNSVIKWITEFLTSGQKLVIFAIHTRVLDDIVSVFGNICVKIDGHTKSDQRREIERRFQTDSNIRLFVGQVVAAGVAITLTAASCVAFLELPWTNADIDQPADRCHRIGQTDTVNVYFLLANDTIENDIIKLLDKNRGVVTKLVTGKEVAEDDLLKNLLDKYTKKGANLES